MHQMGCTGTLDDLLHYFDFLGCEAIKKLRSLAEDYTEMRANIQPPHQKAILE